LVNKPLYGQEEAMFEQLLSQIANRPVAQGITMIDILNIPAPLGGVLRQMLREGALPLSRLAQELALDEPQARALGALLAEKGVVTIEEPAEGGPAYRVRFASARRRELPSRLLQGLEEE
jgi:hypothetical protein